MGLADRANLTMRGAVVAPSGNGVALQCWFRADVLLEGIEAV